MNYKSTSKFEVKETFKVSFLFMKFARLRAYSSLFLSITHWSTVKHAHCIDGKKYIACLPKSTAMSVIYFSVKIWVWTSV